MFDVVFVRETMSGERCCRRGGAALCPRARQTYDTYSVYRQSSHATFNGVKHDEDKQ